MAYRRDGTYIGQYVKIDVFKECQYDGNRDIRMMSSIAINWNSYAVTKLN